MSKNEILQKKEINIQLNREQYRFDVYHMANIFFKFTTIKFREKDCDFKVFVKDDEVLVESKYLKKRYKINKLFKFREEVKKAVFKYFEEFTGKYIPWGTLIGIRPSKRAMDMLIEGESEENIVKHFKDVSFASEEKGRLCIEVAKREIKYIRPEKEKISIYIGMAFCPTRCLYCSFVTTSIASLNKEIVQEYVNCLKKEIKEIHNYIEKRNLKIHTVYFGGGTPTAVNEEQFEDIMNYIYKFLTKDFNVKEFTVECGRPDSINYEKLESMKKYDVTRISINPQTMNEDTLKLIGRSHASSDIIDIFNLARKMEFNNINMDMIVGLPGEKLQHIKNTCNYIEKLKPDSFTVHGLSVKRGSRLHENIINNVKYEIATQNELNLMFNETVKLAKRLKMKPYYMYRQKNMVGSMENIGYSLDEKESIYNIEMMEDRETIIALGANAVTKVVFLDTGKIERFGNVKDVREYILRIDEMIEKKIKLLDILYL